MLHAPAGAYRGVVDRNPPPESAQAGAPIVVLMPQVGQPKGRAGLAKVAEMQQELLRDQC